MRSHPDPEDRDECLYPGCHLKVLSYRHQYCSLAHDTGHKRLLHSLGVTQRQVEGLPSFEGETPLSAEDIVERIRTTDHPSLIEQYILEVWGARHG